MSYDITIRTQAGVAVVPCDSLAALEECRSSIESSIVNGSAFVHFSPTKEVVIGSVALANAIIEIPRKP